MKKFMRVIFAAGLTAVLSGCTSADFGEFQDGASRGAVLIEPVVRTSLKEMSRDLYEIKKEIQKK